MQLSDYDYSLPGALIADRPAQPRSSSRLLDLGDETPVDRRMTDFPDLMTDRDLIVFNDTRVIPARLFGEKPTGGKVEVLIERLLGGSRVSAHVRASKAPGRGAELWLAGGAIRARVIGRDDDLYLLDLEGDRPLVELLETHGHVPLPPYIDRPDEPGDRDDYQTLYAARPGAVAAPTAGLHFDAPLLEALERRGIETAFLTLHVGAGTFQPVRAERIEDHRMHAEFIEVPASLCERVDAAWRRGGRIVAVGTTVVRALETAAAGGALRAYSGDTRLFILPGFQFRVVDALLTNFHLPQSTLLMLVCAFAGYQRVMDGYRHAIAQRYRFYSYGDAMFARRADAV